MAMGRSEGGQDDLMATWAEMPRSPGHAFYDRLQALLREAGFDAFVEQVCKPYYAPRMGAPSLPPGRYFPHAHDRLFRGDRQRARHRMAVRGLVLAARFPAAVEPGQGPRSFVAVAHALASSARGAREGVRLGLEAGRRARSGEGRADRGRRLDDGGQRGAAHDRAARQRRELSRDADADGE